MNRDIPFDYAMLTEDGFVPYKKLDWLDEAVVRKDIFHTKKGWVVQTKKDKKTLEPGDLIFWFNDELKVLTAMDFFDMFLKSFVIMARNKE